MTLTDRLAAICGPANVLTGDDAAPYGRDWMGKYITRPLAAVRPGSTAEVAQVLQLASETRTAVVPMGGNTGLPGGGKAEGALVLSLARMNAAPVINPAARTATVQAGVVLSNLHDAAAAHDLIFPLTFGARQSAMIGGVLSTNAGGSNVVRYGNTRDLCLGVEVVLADGRVMNLMSALHKDNTGYNLRNLVIGAEGTLGVITGAVLKLFPRPRATATAMVATAGLSAALDLLHRVQAATGSMVEAFEYMPRLFIETHLIVVPGAREPFDASHDTNILIEIATTRPDLSTPGPDGAIPLVTQLETILADLMEEGAVLDAVVAQNQTQRAEMWARRESAATLMRHFPAEVDTDVCLPLDKVPTFFERILPHVRRIDPGARDFTVAHLGDGNLHYTVLPSRHDGRDEDALREAVEDIVQELGGSFSAEHGVGTAKLGTMRRRKDPVALDVMRTIKRALDPLNILNPGKVIPD
jgi:FAD/FMN-containing dehydrogenase